MDEHAFTTKRTTEGLAWGGVRERKEKSGHKRGKPKKKKTRAHQTPRRNLKERDPLQNFPGEVREEQEKRSHHPSKKGWYVRQPGAGNHLREEGMEGEGAKNYRGYKKFFTRFRCHKGERKTNKGRR